MFGSTRFRSAPPSSHYQINNTWSFLLQLEQPSQSFQLQIRSAPPASHYQISTTSWSFLLQLEQPFQSFQLQIRSAPPSSHYQISTISWSFLLQLVISTAIRTALSVISTANQISPTISHYQISTTSWSFLLQLEQPFQSFQLQSDQPHLPVIIRPAPPPGHFSCNEAPSLSWCLNKKFAYKRGGA